MIFLLFFIISGINFIMDRLQTLDKDQEIKIILKLEMFKDKRVNVRLTSEEKVTGILFSYDNNSNITLTLASYEHKNKSKEVMEKCVIYHSNIRSINIM